MWMIIRKLLQTDKNQRSFPLSYSLVLVACGSKILWTRNAREKGSRNSRLFPRGNANCSPLCGEMQIRNAPRTISSSQMLARNTRRVIVRTALPLKRCIPISCPSANLPSDLDSFPQFDRNISTEVGIQIQIRLFIFHSEYTLWRETKKFYHDQTNRRYRVPSK